MASDDLRRLALSGKWLVPLLAVIFLAGLWPAIAAEPAAPDGPANDWPQYRGPERSGAVPWPTAVWPDGGPREVWRRPIGEGFSEVVVVGAALVTMESTAGKSFVVCLDAGTGELRWRREVGGVFENEFGNGSRSTPSVSDNIVFAFTSEGRLLALDLASGAPHWQVDLRQRFGGDPPTFGHSPSPLVDQGLVLIEAGGEGDASIVALDSLTGQLRWQVHRDRMGYSSPIAMETAGQHQYVFVTPAHVVGINPAGALLWRWPIEGSSRIDLPIAMPVAVSGRGVFVSHRAEGGSVLLDPSSRTNGRPAEVWAYNGFRNHWSSAVVVGDHLYGFHNATLKAISTVNGEESWAKRGLGKGSLIAIGSQLLVWTDRGDLVAIEAAPAAYHELGRLRVFEARTWTAPSFARGQLYLRHHQEIVRLEMGGDHSARRASMPSPVTSDTKLDTTPLLGLPTLGSPTLGSPTLEQILARHLEARGGPRWRAVQSIRAIGRYAEVSAEVGFVLTRRRPDVYQFERRAPDGTLVAAPLTDAEIENNALEKDFDGPLIDAGLKGHQLKLVGLVEFGARQAYEIVVRRKEGVVERWFLDPSSFLPRARIAPLNAYGNQFEATTYFSDYRKVEGVLVAHLIEVEFSSIHRMMKMEQVNVDLADE